MRKIKKIKLAGARTKNREPKSAKRGGVAASLRKGDLKNNDNDKLGRAIENISVHDHLCLIYKNKKEQFATVVPFMRIGLERGEKCVYVADENTANDVMEAMRAGGIDVNAARKKGSLAIITKKDAYLRHGYFDPDEMIKFLEESTVMAKKEGYMALRVTGEMTWMLGGEKGTERLLEYESRLNRFFPKYDCLALCQYNRKRFSSDILLGVIYTHPIVVVGNVVCKNFYYIPVEEFLKAGKGTSEEVDRLLNNLLDRERIEAEQKQIEQEIRESEEKFIAAFNSSPDLMAIMRVSDGMILEVNEGYTRLLGYSRDESIGRTTAELSIWADAADRDRFVSALQKDGQVLDFETALRCKDGTTVTVIDSVRTFDLQGEKCILSTAHDITNRKKMETELAQKNRALYLLNNINQVLIHAADETSLLNETCRIVVENGEYRMSWIGFAEQDKAKTVRPVARAGVESGYLESAKIVWADTERGRGPTGTAIRTGEAKIARDILNDSAMAPWRKAALEHGYQSSIALPLKSGEQVFGALNIYSDKANGFDIEEVKILEELANDLAFGIVALRTTAEHRLLEEELLKASTERYKALFVSSRDAVMTLEPPSWRFTSGNPATVKMFGVKSEGNFLLSEPWALSPERQPDGRNSMERAKEMIEKAMREGINFFEWTHKRMNGEEFPAEVLLSRVEQSGKFFLHAVVRDITERKKLEEQLKEYAEEKFRIVFDNANDGMVLVDEATRRFTLGNKSFSRMLGYDSEEIKSLTVSDIHPLKDLPHVLELFEKQMKREIDIAENIPIKRKDGSIFYADINASPIVVEDRKLVLGVFRDITERKKMEDELRISEERFRRIFENGQYGIILTGTNSKFIKVNPAFCRITGYTEAELLTKTFADITHPENIKADTAAVPKLISGEIPYYHTEKRYVRKTGETIWVDLNVSVIRNADRSVGYFLGMLEDITEHKKMEEEIRKSTEDLKKFKMAVEATSDHVILTDSNGVILYANKAAEILTGYSAEEMVGNRPSLWGNRMPDVFYKAMWKTIKKDKKHFIGELINRRKNGQSYDVELRISPVLDEAGDVKYFVGVERDITKTKQISRAQNEFISISSHQLRTPLTGIQWVVERFLKTEKLSPRGQEYLKDIHDSVMRLGGLINTLLNASRIESGKTTIAVVPVEVVGLVADCLKEFDPLIASKKQTLTFDTKLERIEMQTDQNVFRNILQSLVSNAIEYTPEQGHVKVSLEKKEDKIILAISDTGIGISDNDTNFIFKKFFRAENARLVKAGGTGLGLYIAWESTKMLGGTIAFASRVNQGTTFTVMLPVVAKAMEEEESRILE